MESFIEQSSHFDFDGKAGSDLFKSSAKLYEEISFEIGKKSTFKPLRGLGRYKPSFNIVEDRIDKIMRLTDPGPLKGLGRKQTFYSNLFQWFSLNKSKQVNHIKRSYNYWRGLGKPISAINYQVT